MGSPMLAGMEVQLQPAQFTILFLVPVTSFSVATRHIAVIEECFHANPALCERSQCCLKILTGTMRNGIGE